MKFVRLSVRRPRATKPMKYGWVMMIRNVVDLLDYFEKYEAGRYHEAWVDISKNLYPDPIGARVNNPHLTKDLALGISILADIRNESILGAMGSLSGQKFKSMAESMPLYANCNGGWMRSEEGMTHTRTIESDKWPTDMETEPRYIKWPGGTHWYCKVGPEDVVVDGEQKWDTKRAAQRAFRKWQKESK